MQSSGLCTGFLRVTQLVCSVRKHPDLSDGLSRSVPKVQTKHAEAEFTFYAPHIWKNPSDNEVCSGSALWSQGLKQLVWPCYLRLALWSSCTETFILCCLLFYLTVFKSDSCASFQCVSSICLMSSGEQLELFALKHWNVKNKQFLKLPTYFQTFWYEESLNGGDWMDAEWQISVVLVSVLTGCTNSTLSCLRSIRPLISLPSTVHQALDCSPANRERELGLERREALFSLLVCLLWVVERRRPSDCFCSWKGGPAGGFQ